MALLEFHLRSGLHHGPPQELPVCFTPPLTHSKEYGTPQLTSNNLTSQHTSTHLPAQLTSPHQLAACSSLSLRFLTVGRRQLPSGNLKCTSLRTSTAFYSREWRPREVKGHTAESTAEPAQELQELGGPIPIQSTPPPIHESSTFKKMQGRTSEELPQKRPLSFPDL